MKGARGREIFDAISRVAGGEGVVSPEVIAEGIETEEQLQALVDLGVACGQGYHLGAPAPIG